MEILKTHWMLQSEELFKAEYDIPDIDFDDMSPEEQERTKAFYGRYCEPTALYMELANRIFDITNRGEELGMAPYNLMVQSYMSDAKNNDHFALENLTRTYRWLLNDEPEA